MFPKCSLDVSNIATLREHSANIPGILRASWDSVEAKRSTGAATISVNPNKKGIMGWLQLALTLDASLGQISVKRRRSCIEKVWPE